MDEHAKALVRGHCFMKRSALVFGFFIAAYVLGYFLLMARNVSAVDRNDQILFRSSFRMAPGTSTVAPGGVTTIVRGVTFLNYVFYPLDIVYYAIVPKGMSFNTMPVD